MRTKPWKTHCKTFPGTGQKPLCRRHFSSSAFEPPRLEDEHPAVPGCPVRHAARIRCSGRGGSRAAGAVSSSLEEEERHAVADEMRDPLGAPMEGAAAPAPQAELLVRPDFSYGSMDLEGYKLLA